MQICCDRKASASVQGPQQAAEKGLNSGELPEKLDRRECQKNHHAAREVERRLKKRIPSENASGQVR